MQSREKLYRDVVHKDIIWDELATAIINTPEFQRLDGIKQLGFAELVYRGAKHSRFEHSIGAYWIAKQIMQLIPSNHLRLGIDLPTDEIFNENLGKGSILIDNLSRIVSYAALLHDITHVPFGHTLEDEMQGIFEHKHDDFDSPRLPYLLYNPKSGVTQIFRRKEDWLPGIRNDDLLHLLTIIIVYKDEVGKPGFDKLKEKTFDEILNEKIDNYRKQETALKEKPIVEILQEKISNNKKRDITLEEISKIIQYLQDVHDWYLNLKKDKIYHPFMTDIVANTICSDILDYIRRDVLGTGLVMDFDHRVLRYFVLGKEIIKDGEVWRLALCIRDPKKGIDKIDIAGEVLNILNLRYSLAERVYYHKSKVSAGAMLAKAISLVRKPNEPLYVYQSSSNALEIKPMAKMDNHVLEVNMTDDGFLRWLDEEADAQMKNSEPTPPMIIDEKLGNPKNLNGAQYVLHTGDGKPLTAALSSWEKAKRAKKVVLNLRERKLYKPVVILTYDLARHERRVKYFYTKYCNREICKKTELEIAGRCELNEGDLIIYCPKPQPQIKQMETRVLAKDNTVLPLWDDDRFKTYANSIADRYEQLWKFFIFLNPELFINPIIRQRVTEEFYKYEKISKIEMKELAPYQWLKDEQKEAWEEYNNNRDKMDSRLWHPKLGQLLEDSQSWEYIWSQGPRRNPNNRLVLASAALYLCDYIVDHNTISDLHKPSWLGIENILNGTKLRPRLFKNMNWKQEIESQLNQSINRDNLNGNEIGILREAYYQLFQSWEGELGGE